MTWKHQFRSAPAHGFDNLGKVEIVAGNVIHPGGLFRLANWAIASLGDIIQSGAVPHGFVIPTDDRDEDCNSFRTVVEGGRRRIHVTNLSVLTQDGLVIQRSDRTVVDPEDGGVWLCWRRSMSNNHFDCELTGKCENQSGWTSMQLCEVSGRGDHRLTSPLVQVGATVESFGKLAELKEHLERLERKLCSLDAGLSGDDLGIAPLLFSIRVLRQSRLFRRNADEVFEKFSQLEFYARRVVKRLNSPSRFRRGRAAGAGKSATDGASDVAVLPSWCPIEGDSRSAAGFIDELATGIEVVEAVSKLLTGATTVEPELDPLPPFETEGGRKAFRYDLGDSDCREVIVSNLNGASVQLHHHGQGFARFVKKDGPLEFEAPVFWLAVHHLEDLPTLQVSLAVEQDRNGGRGARVVNSSAVDPNRSDSVTGRSKRRGNSVSESSSAEPEAMTAKRKTRKTKPKTAIAKAKTRTAKKKTVSGEEKAVTAKKKSVSAKKKTVAAKKKRVTRVRGSA